MLLAMFRYYHSQGMTTGTGIIGQDVMVRWQGSVNIFHVNESFSCSLLSHRLRRDCIERGILCLSCKWRRAMLLAFFPVYVFWQALQE